MLLAITNIFIKKEIIAHKLLAWQLPSVFAFTLLSRHLFPRHLYYLIPTLIILCVIIIDPLRHAHNRIYYFLFLGVILIPWMWNNGLSLTSRDTTTLFVANQISNLVDADTKVLSDYQELNFHAKRISTYHGAELSFVIIDGGSLTGEMLIIEMKENIVGLVVIDVST